MIIKPSSPGQGGPALARYLMTGKNEHAEVLELRNMDAPSLQAALYRMDALGKGSQCRAHALHIQMRAAPGERLSASHWQEAADRVTALFDMERHQAALVLHHQPDGCTHAHLVLNRVHPETLIAADVWRSKKKCIDLSRQLEKEWGLRQVSSQSKNRHRDCYSKAARNEAEQARRQGAHAADLQEHIRQLWEHSPNGLAFADALEAEGYQLAQGDRRAYVVLDPHGGTYSVGQRTTGAKAREVREKLGDLDPATVPTITEGRRLLAERQAEQKQQRRQGKGEARAQSQPTPAPAPAPAPEQAKTQTLTPEQTPATKPAPEQAPAVSWWTAASQRAALNPKVALPLHCLSAAPRPTGPRATRRAQWEEAAAKRLQGLRNWQALEREQQARRFTEEAKLERGDAVKAFNTQQRDTLTNLLYKEQAEALAGEMQRQQAQRERWDKPTQRTERRQAPRTYPPPGFKAWLSALFTAKAAKPAPTPQPARPLSPAEAIEALENVSRLARVMREREERQRREREEEREAGRSIVDDWLDAHFRKGNTPR